VHTRHCVEGGREGGRGGVAISRHSDRANVRERAVELRVTACANES